MSSNGTSLACENKVVINKEDNITSTEESYSFLPQSEQFNPKQAARSKFNKTDDLFVRKRTKIYVGKENQFLKVYPSQRRA